MRLPGYPSSGLLGLSCLALSACSGGDSSTDHRSASLSLGPCEGEPGLDTMLDYARFDLRAGAAPHVRLAFGELLRGRIEICGGKAISSYRAPRSLRALTETGNNWPR